MRGVCGSGGVVGRSRYGGRGLHCLGGGRGEHAKLSQDLLELLLRDANLNEGTKLVLRRVQ